MSGRRIYNITNDMLERELANLRKQQQSQLNQINTLNQANLQKVQNNFQSKLEQARLAQQNELKKLSHEFQEAERNHQKAISDVYKHINKTQAEMKNYVDSSVGDLRQEIRLRIENKEEAANQWKGYFEFITNDIIRLNGNIFLSDESQPVLQSIQLINRNIQSGNYEAAIGLCQSKYLDGMIIRQRLEQINLRANYLIQVIEQNKESLNDLTTKGETTEIEYDTDEGEKAKEPVKISYWAEDDWNNLLSQKKTLDDVPLENTNLDDLESLAKDSEELIKLYQEIVIKARLKHINYVAAMDKQEEIAERLEEMGYQIVENLHENEDERGANILLMENASGEKILIRIQEQKLNVSYSTLINPVTHRENVKTLNDIIGVEGVDEPGYETRPAPPEDFEMERYRKRQT